MRELPDLELHRDAFVARNLGAPPLGLRAIGPHTFEGLGERRRETALG